MTFLGFFFDLFVGSKVSTLQVHIKAWDKLKEKFQGSVRIRKMQVLNLERKFDALRIKETKVDKLFMDRLLKIVNYIRILREKLSYKRMVKKVCVSLLKKFVVKDTSLKESKDLN